MKLTFVNRFLTLPADTVIDNHTRQVHGAAYSSVKPTPTNSPQLIAYSEELATSLGFSCEDLQSSQFEKVFSGNQLLPSMQPFSMCYGGHQFGHWAGQLGDGRAINLGEIKTPTNEYKTLQLKGAGATPYSRNADGLAVLRSSIREFLCSEAMYHLGIPTTRALSLCLTGDNVLRDMFYDGNAKEEHGAVVCRVSSSFMRFGSFQLPTARNDIKLLQQLVDYCISTDFAHLIKDEPLSTQTYLQWFKEVCQRTCSLMVHWLRVGFVHGVMNTDNMSIIGETIDYGPYGWLDDFDPQWTPNTTDAQGKRYCYGNQAEISQWNLFQLANAIFPLINQAEPLQQILNDYAVDFQQQWLAMMQTKLGLLTTHKDDLSLILALEELLSRIETDMTIFYRQLAKIPIEQELLKDNAWFHYFEHCYYVAEQVSEDYLEDFSQWLAAYFDRIKLDQSSQEQRVSLMNSVNPNYVLRNYLAQQAIDKAELGDYSEIKRLQKILSHPYDEQPNFQEYAQKRPAWAKNKAGCGMLSCSS